MTKKNSPKTTKITSAPKGLIKNSSADKFIDKIRKDKATNAAFTRLSSK